MMYLLPVFLTWTQDDTDLLIGNISDLIGDLTPLLIPIIAIGLGLMIISVIISVIRRD